jgi:hypothetical protein
MYQLGNLISWHSTNDVDIVKKIERKGKRLFINDVCISDVKPIHITSKLLENFDSLREHWFFVINDEGDFFCRYDNLHVIYSFEQKKVSIRNFKISEGSVVLDCEFLHQLQNIISVL